MTSTVDTAALMGILAKVVRHASDGVLDPLERARADGRDRIGLVSIETVEARARELLTRATVLEGR